MNFPPQQLRISFGHNQLELCIKGSVQTLSIKEPAQVIDEKTFSKKLGSVFQHGNYDLSDPIIVVADKTRVCGYPEYLPVLVQELVRYGAYKKNIKFIIAYGTHLSQSDAECRRGYGTVYDEYTFIHHDCNKVELFEELGTTSRGTPIRIRKDILNASGVITMGPICHHYFAGYGGGRKLIFPGCGEKEAIYYNHGLYLNRDEKRLSVSCQPGILENNPIAEDLFEIAQTRQADLSIHGIINSHGELCDVVLGSTRDEFLAVCDIHGELCEQKSDSFDLVIGSCGGYPKDINFIQSHKAIHNAAMFVKDGGTLVMYTECCDGIGSETFLPWFEEGGFSKAFEKLSASYEGNGGTALAMMTKLQRIKIILVTSLDDSICTLIGVEKKEHDEVQELVDTRTGTIAWIPNGSLLVRRGD